MVLYLLGQPPIATAATIWMRKEPSESKLKIISKLIKVLLRIYSLQQTTYTHSLSTQSVLVFGIAYMTSNTGAEERHHDSDRF